MAASKDELKIRPLRESELGDMVAIWKTSGLPYRPSGRDKTSALRAQRKAMPDLFLGAFVNGGLVGVVLASDDTRKGWLNRIAVVPDARGRGVARALIAASEAALRKRGRRLFCAQIEGYNRESMRLFEKEGYAREEDIFYYTKRERKDY